MFGLCLYSSVFFGIVRNDLDILYNGLYIHACVGGVFNLEGEFVKSFVAPTSVLIIFLFFMFCNKWGFIKKIMLNCSGLYNLILF